MASIKNLEEILVMLTMPDNRSIQQVFSFLPLRSTEVSNDGEPCRPTDVNYFYAGRTAHLKLKKVLLNKHLAVHDNL